MEIFTEMKFLSSFIKVLKKEEAKFFVFFYQFSENKILSHNESINID